jgi:hypothetical protein
MAALRGNGIPELHVARQRWRNHYYIDARGTDAAAVEMRVRRAVAEAQQGAVSTSIKAQREFQRRTPISRLRRSV